MSSRKSTIRITIELYMISYAVYIAMLLKRKFETVLYNSYASATYNNKNLY